MLLLAWQVVDAVVRMSPPCCSCRRAAVWDVLAESWPILLQQAWPSLVNTVVGFGLAAVLGVVLGGVLVASRRVEQALWPHVLIFQLIPKVALAPLFIIWLGMGPSSRLCFAVFLSFFPRAGVGGGRVPRRGRQRFAPVPVAAGQHLAELCPCAATLCHPAYLRRAEGGGDGGDHWCGGRGVRHGAERALATSSCSRPRRRRRRWCSPPSSCSAPSAWGCMRPWRSPSSSSAAGMAPLSQRAGSNKC